MKDEAESTDGEGTPRTLWALHKDGHTMSCVMSSGAADHIDLNVLMDGELYLSETHAVRDGALGRSRTLLRGFEAHGWTAESP